MPLLMHFLVLKTTLSLAQDPKSFSFIVHFFGEIEKGFFLSFVASIDANVHLSFCPFQFSVVFLSPLSRSELSFLHFFSQEICNDGTSRMPLTWSQFGKASSTCNVV